LIQYGGGVNTALMLAAQYGHVEAIIALIQDRANVNQADEN